jgi:FkbM family methyltransferase
MFKWLKKNVQGANVETKTISGLGFYKTKTGKYYLPEGIDTDLIINAIKHGKIFEPQILDVAKRYIKPGTAVLDVGANLGQMSILLSRLVGENGRVFAFEADDFIYDALSKNIVANERSNITAVFGAVSDKDGEVVFYPVPDFKRFGSWGSYGIDPNAKEGRKVPTITIDKMAIEMPISFMKVDVQGSDLFALRGAVKTIEKNHMPIIFEFEEQFQEEFRTSFKDYIDFVERIAYRVEEIVDGINYLILPK